MARFNDNLLDRRKLALIIDNHRSNNRVKSSIRHGQDLCEVLEKINFNIPISVGTSDDIIATVQDFTKKMKAGDLILFYFSGYCYQYDNKKYLLPNNEERIKEEEDLPMLATNAQRILERLTRDNLPYVTIMILDCCRSCRLSKRSTSHSDNESHASYQMKALPRTFIQFACSDCHTNNDDLFIKHLLRNLPKQNTDIREVFQCISDDVYLESHEQQIPVSIHDLSRLGPMYFNQVNISLPDIPSDAVWTINAKTIAGGKGPGHASNQLHFPHGLCVNKNGAVFVADCLNHRIMKYNRNTTFGRMIAGQNVQGYASDLLARPSNLVFDSITKSLYICDTHNRRVLKWSLRTKTYTKVIAKNIACFGLAVDNEGCLYVSDTERHEIRRYRPGRKYGTVVAGGNGQGSFLHQLNYPTYIVIGDNKSIYVSDSWNDRVVRWDQNAEKGVIVAGGHGKGSTRDKLDNPTGLLLDRLGTIYVSDHYNNRVMRWCNDMEEGDIIIDGNIPGSCSKQLNGPEGLAFDKFGNLLVADSNNHRIQKFFIWMP